MSDNFEIGRMTNGQMSHLAQTDPGPFEIKRPPLRSFWYGQLAQRWHLSGSVTKMDFLGMTNLKRPFELATQEAIDHFKGTPNNEMLSGGWCIRVVQTESVVALMESDPRVVDIAVEALRETFSFFEYKIHALIPGHSSQKTGLGAFCAFVYSDKAFCFLFDVTVTDDMERSFPIDEKLLLGAVSPGWEVQQ